MPTVEHDQAQPVHFDEGVELLVAWGIGIAANKKADAARARSDAKKYKLNSTFAATKVDPNFTM